MFTWITVAILELIHATRTVAGNGHGALIRSKPIGRVSALPWLW